MIMNLVTDSFLSITTKAWATKEKINKLDHTKIKNFYASKDIILLLSHKKESMPFAATCMDPEIIMLSGVSQRQISYDITYIWNL